jgi:putative FmdB family regulatory protein
MPIFEFKCLKCEAFMEVLVVGSSDEQVPMRCKECGSEELERVISATNFSMAVGSGHKSGPSATSRTCSSGSCTTWSLPGHSK